MDNDEPTSPGSDAPAEPPTSGSTPPHSSTPGPPPPPPSGATGDTGAPPPPPAGSTGHAVPPHPSGIPADSRNWAMGAHLSAFVGAMVALAFMGPLVVWLVRRDQGDGFAEHHAKEALNFQLSMLVYLIGGSVVGALLALLTLGIGLIVIVPVGVAVFLAWVVLPILAAVKASNGEGYRYPITIRFVS